MGDLHTLELIRAPRSHGSDSDFKIGRYRLIPHLGEAGVCVLDVDPEYFARLLLQRVETPLPDGRAALFVHGCGDVYCCGCMSVKVEMQGDVVTWRDFAPASPEGDHAFTPEPHVARTGPFRFDREHYHRLLVPLSR